MTQRLSRGKGESPKLIVRMPASLIDSLKRAAKADRRSMSDWVRLALEDALKKGDRR